MTAVLLIHAAATWYMVGVIWKVQLVQYPMFAEVGAASFGRYHRGHMNGMGRVVGPPMLVEAVTAVWLAWVPPAGVAGWIPWTGLGLVAILWLSTAFIQVPLHDRLTKGYDRPTITRLVVTNWIRTFIWSVRGVLALLLLAA